jgi:hypothetical protein
MSATTTQLLPSGEFCKPLCDTIPVKSASANVSFYTSNTKMPNFELWHSCRKWAVLSTNVWTNPRTTWKPVDLWNAAATLTEFLQPWTACSGVTCETKRCHSPESCESKHFPLQIRKKIALVVNSCVRLFVHVFLGFWIGQHGQNQRRLFEQE